MAKKATKQNIYTKDVDSDSIVSQLNKKYGENSLISASKAKGMTVRFFSTGCYALDFGTGGGIPENRITEIRGPYSSLKSTLSLLSAAEFQRKYEEGIVFFVDMERTFDPEYTENLGVDLSRIVIVTPDSGEQAGDLVNEVLHYEKPTYVILDSIAAMTPTAELEASMEDQMMGVQARMINRIMRTAVSALKRTMYDASLPSITVLCINQLREKVGVVYGCNHADNIVDFSDGRSATIREVVENKMKGDVLTPTSRGKMVAKPIVDWHYNGEVEDRLDWVTISCVAPIGTTKNGIISVTLTPNHEVKTFSGEWKKAKEVTRSDYLCSKSYRLKREEDQTLLSAIALGDSTIDRKGMIRFSDKNNPNYADLKKSLFTFDNCSSILSNLYETEFRNPSKIIPNIFSNPQALAIWIMDDFHFRGGENRQRHTALLTYSLKRFNDKSEAIDLCEKLKSKFGEVSVIFEEKGNRLRASFCFSKESYELLTWRARDYILPEFEYKLPPKHKNRNYCSISFTGELEIIEYKSPVLEAGPASDRKFRQRGRYDISIADNPYYLAGNKDNGIVVHNSPETAPGGKGKEFAYSAIVRVSSSKSDAIIEKVTRNGVQRSIRYGQKMKFEVIKNKVAKSQFDAGEVTFFVRKYKENKPNTFDNVSVIYRYGIFYGLIELDSDNTKRYEDIEYKSDSQFKKELNNRPDLMDSLYTDIQVAMHNDSNLAYEVESSDESPEPKKNAKKKLARKKKV